MSQPVSAAPRPAPLIDPQNAFYWEGLRGEELRLQRCSACGRFRSPPLPACPSCGDVRAEIELSSGRGALYSWVVVHRAFSETFADDVPYTVGVVELDEGCRMLARIELDGEPSLGLPVRVAYREHAGDDPWTEAFFRADASSRSSE